MEEELVEVKVPVEDMEVLLVVVPMAVVEVEGREAVAAAEAALRVVVMEEELVKEAGKVTVEVGHMAAVMLVAAEVAVAEAVVLGVLLVAVMEVGKEAALEVDTVENMVEDMEVEVAAVAEVASVVVGHMEADMVMVEEQVEDMGVEQLVVVAVLVVAAAMVVEVHMEGDMVVVPEVAKVVATVDITPELAIKFNVHKELIPGYS